MPRTRMRLTHEPAALGHAVPDGRLLVEAFDAVRAELDLPTGFPPEVLAAAQEAAASPALPEKDWTDVPFVTIDPPGATDLDQALHIEPRGSGHRVRYAIADVPAFVRPGSPVDAEARRRGQTLYAPDGRVPLHPPALSEHAASLLPGQDRPAFVWVIDLDADGETTAVDVVRAVVRSRAQLDYAGVQADVDAGRPPSGLEALRQVGEQRVALERARGGASLAVPDTEVVAVDGTFRLRYAPPLAVEDWNAQISLLTGMAAADLMLAGEVGILRTMPAPDARTLARFHRQASALGLRWDAETPYGEYLRSLDPHEPRQLALLHESAALFRGAGYTPFEGAPPEQAEQAAVAAPYAHVTAPLRRLVDRFALAICSALCAGADVPDWARAALAELPAAMADSDRRAGALERGCLDAAEAAVLASAVGRRFDAVVVDVDDDGDSGEVQVLDPPVLARCDGPLELGARTSVRLVEADVLARRVRFEQ
jgi:exoribonuclease R